MKRIYTGILAFAAISSLAAMAQTSGTPSTTTPATATSTSAPVTGKTIQERKNNQQERIGNGVENGSLTAGEAANLEKKESNLNKEERNMRAADGGKLTDADKAKLTRQQNTLSKDIYQQKHDAQVQPKANNEVNARDKAQQERIGQGIKSGQLTAGETAKLENQQKGINQQVQADRAANGGKLTPGEKKQINKEQNAASKNVYNKKHNGNTQGTKK